MKAPTLDGGQLDDSQGQETIERVTAGDGYLLTYRRWRPTRDVRGTIVLFNGIMSHSGWFTPLVAPLLQAGYALVGADRRGSGLNDRDRGDAPSAKEIVRDALAIVDDAVPAEQPLLLAGWCWGAILALNLLRPLGDRVSSLALLTPGLFPTQQVVNAAERAEQAAAGAAEDAAVVAVPILETMFTQGPCLESFVRVDPHKLEVTTPRFVGHTKKLAMTARIALSRLSVPTLVVLAEDDEATNNDAVRQALGSLPVTQRTLPGAHGLQFDAPEALADALATFFDDTRKLHEEISLPLYS